MGGYKLVIHLLKYPAYAAAKGLITSFQFANMG